MSSDDTRSGVDLNRNYGFKFGVDNEGSSSDPCDEIYRGIAAFSEPETQAVRNLVLRSRKISSAINFHAYGNLWINPYSYSANDENKLLFDSNVFEFYEAFHGILKANRFTHFGTAQETIKYVANGEASDWMLGEHGIICLSPELGALNNKSDAFYLTNDELIEVVKDGYSAVEHWFEFNMPIFSQVKLSCQQSVTRDFATNSSSFQQQIQVYRMTLSFKNSGIVDLRSLSLMLTFNSMNDAKMVDKLDFNRNLDSPQVSLVLDDSLTKVRAKGKVKIPKLSDNKIVIEFKRKVEGPISLQFFKLNKEIASILLTEDQVARAFGRTWVKSVEFKVTLFLLLFFTVVFVYLKVAVFCRSKSVENSYRRPETEQNCDLNKIT